MLFTLLLLVGLVDADGLANLYPGHVDPMSARSLVALAENDPKAFTALFAKADPEKLEEIIVLLHNLIVQATNDLKHLRDTRDDAKKNYTETSDRAKAKEIVCLGLGKVVKNAEDAVKVATTKFDKSKDAYTQAEPGIQDEIATVQGIIRTLSELTSIQKPGRSMLSGSILPIAMLQDLTNADSKDINEVVKLLRELIKDASDDLTALKNTLDTARLALQQATGHLKDADEASGICVEKLNILHLQTNATSAAYDVAETDFNERKPQINKEINTLQRVIKILKDLQM